MKARWWLRVPTNVIWEELWFVRYCSA
jgi:hypothetical protein